MSKPTTLKVIPKTLDVAALDAMVEPLTVQCSRIKGTQHTPIPLPAGEGGLAGVGWSKGEVQEMVGGWLVNHWSGGGLYQFTATDASTPPNTLTWQSWWSPNDYPERVPPTLSEGMRPAPSPVASITPINAQPQPQAQVPMAFPNGLPQLPPGTLLPPTQSYGYQAPQYQQPYVPSYGPPQMQYGYGGGNAAAEAERRRYEEQMAQMQKQLADAKIEAERRQFQAELERERAANATAMQRLEAKLTEMATSARTPAVSPELEAIKESNRLLEARLEAEKRERELERREREARDQLNTMKAAIDQQIAMMRESMQQLIASSANKGVDPMMQMMIEQNRTSVAAMERIAGQSNTAIDSFKQFMMSPRDVMAIAKDASSGTDAVTQKLATAYGSVMEMQQKVLENSLSLNQGGSPVVEMIREGAANVKELAQRYISSTNRVKQVEAQSQAQIVNAHAQRDAIQAQAQAAIVNAQSRVAPQIVQPMPSQPRPVAQAGLGNAAPAPNGAATFEEWKKQHEGSTHQAAQPRETADVTPQPTSTVMPPARVMQAVPNAPHVRTDEEWFGPALPEVMTTRVSLDEFFAELAKGDAAQLHDQMATPDNVAKGVALAAAHVQQHNIPIPAMQELLFQGKYDEFVRVLLPNGSENYWNDLVHELRVMSGEIEETDEDDDDPDNQDEDGSPSDDVADGSSVPPAPAQKPTVRIIRPS